MTSDQLNILKSYIKNIAQSTTTIAPIFIRFYAIKDQKHVILPVHWEFNNNDEIFIYIDESYIYIFDELNLADNKVINFQPSRKAPLISTKKLALAADLFQKKIDAQIDSIRIWSPNNYTITSGSKDYTVNLSTNSVERSYPDPDFND